MTRCSLGDLSHEALLAYAQDLEKVVRRNGLNLPHLRVSALKTASIGAEIEVPTGDIRFTEDGKLVVHPASRNSAKAEDVVTLRKAQDGFEIVVGPSPDPTRTRTIPLTVIRPLPVEYSLGWNNIVGFVFD